MSDLTTEQKAYLNHHNIKPNQVFNAKGLANREYKVIMKELNKTIAFNVSPCNKKGHTLRTRGGHCIQCNSAVITFQNRANLQGIVYIAGTKNGGMLKVGFSKSLTIREGSLNRTYYGCQTDWELLFVIKSNIAGRLELETHNSLKDYKVTVKYDHDGHHQITNETFRQNYSLLKEKLLEISRDLDDGAEVILDKITMEYEFDGFKTQDSKYNSGARLKTDNLKEQNDQDFDNTELAQISNSENVADLNPNEILLDKNFNEKPITEDSYIDQSISKPDVNVTQNEQFSDDDKTMRNPNSNVGSIWIRIITFLKSIFK